MESFQLKVLRKEHAFLFRSHVFAGLESTPTPVQLKHQIEKYNTICSHLIDARNPFENRHGNRHILLEWVDSSFCSPSCIRRTIYHRCNAYEFDWNHSSNSDYCGLNGIETFHEWKKFLLWVTRQRRWVSVVLDRWGTTFPVLAWVEVSMRTVDPGAGQCSLEG
jgi:hypothetical protein